MKSRPVYLLLALLAAATLLVAGCAQTPAPSAEPTSPSAPQPTAAPPEEPTAEPGAEGPCLIIGALHGGPITDAGYNQAMHEGVMAIKANIPCVEIIEAENVPEEAGATSIMENMIQQGATMIIATAPAPGTGD